MKTYITKKQAKEILLKKECKLNLPRMGRIILFAEPNNKIALGIAGEKLVGRDGGGYYFENWAENRMKPTPKQIEKMREVLSEIVVTQFPTVLTADELFGDGTLWRPFNRKEFSEFYMNYWKEINKLSRDEINAFFKKDKN